MVTTRERAMRTDAADRRSTPATGAAPDEGAGEVRDRPTALRRSMLTWAKTPSGRIWLDAAWIWLLSRAAFLAITFLALTLLLPAGGPDAVARWATQDAAHFTFIAQYGYYPLVRAAFWPLFPALEHILGPLTGGSYAVAGLIISNAAFFGALVALRQLAEREVGADAARRATLYLAIFPTAFYFFAPYSESLFLLLSIGAFAALRDRRWWLAGLLGCATTLDRAAGMLLLLPFGVEYLLALRQRAARWWDVAWSALIPAAAGIYSAYFWLQHRDPLAYLHAQAFWGRTIQAPWVVVTVSIGEVLHAGGGGHLIA
jgi:Gpi18-like mannosyltransferase